VERQDWTLLAISLAKGRGLSPVQLQKVLFLLGKSVPSDIGSDFYTFEPYNYGPFDRTIYSDAGFLSTVGLVNISSTGSGYSEYTATPEGQTRSEIIKATASPRAVAYLEKVVPWAQALSFSSLVRAIYNKYPEYRRNSVFQG
jgi:uncharacterized protein